MGLGVKEYHILSLGAGVQSTTVYLLALEGKLPITAAVFADTGDEPVAVYEHVAWLQSLNGPRIYVVSKGHRLSAALMQPVMVNSKLLTGRKTRFASVPFFTRKPDGEIGMTRRQSSKEYKVEVVERCIRRSIIGLKPRCRVPKHVTVNQYFGISSDEARRSLGIRKRVANPHFPLMELGGTRADCQAYLKDRVPHETPRSACVYCPFHSDAEWMRVKAVPEDWALALRVDEALRVEGAIVNRNMDAQMFAHRSCVPLVEVEFKHERQFNMFTTECEGVCGV
jgi:hypothetical protein